MCIYLKFYKRMYRIALISNVYMIHIILCMLLFNSIIANQRQTELKPSFNTETIVNIEDICSLPGKYYVRLQRGIHKNLLKLAVG